MINQRKSTSLTPLPGYQRLPFKCLEPVRVAWSMGEDKAGESLIRHYWYLVEEAIRKIKAVKPDVDEAELESDLGFRLYNVLCRFKKTEAIIKDGMGAAHVIGDFKRYVDKACNTEPQILENDAAFEAMGMPEASPEDVLLWREFLAYAEKTMDPRAFEACLFTAKGATFDEVRREITPEVSMQRAHQVADEGSHDLRLLYKRWMKGERKPKQVYSVMEGLYPANVEFTRFVMPKSVPDVDPMTHELLRLRLEDRLSLQAIQYVHDKEALHALDTTALRSWLTGAMGNLKLLPDGESLFKKASEVDAGIAVLTNARTKGVERAEKELLDYLYVPRMAKVRAEMRAPTPVRDPATMDYEMVPGE